MAILGLNKQDDTFESNVEMKSKSFGIGDASAIIDILRNRMYSMPIQTLVQEYICNGRDASIEAGTFGKRKIKITSPTKLSCEFRVRDFGVGMSEDRVSSVFTQYGNSTKRASNTQIGGYGLGAKSAWAYTDSFTVVSFYNGTKTTYLCHVGKDNIGSMDVLNTEKTSEENGVEIVVTVKPDDIKKFTQAIKRVLAFWNKDSYELNITLDKKTALYTDNLCSVYDLKVDHNPDDYGYNNRGVFFTVDDVIFPLPQSIVNNITHNETLYIHLKTGEVDVAPSREAIIDNDKVKAVLNKYNAHLARIKREIELEKTIDLKVKKGQEYKTLLQSVIFQITPELEYYNGEVKIQSNQVTRRLTNQNSRLVIDDYDASRGRYRSASTFKIDKRTVVLIADTNTKNIPSKVIHALSGRSNKSWEYAIVLPVNNLPQYLIDNLTVLEVDKLPLPPKQKSAGNTQVNLDGYCKELTYSYWSGGVTGTLLLMSKMNTTNAIRVPYTGFSEDYPLRQLMKEDTSLKVYALKKEDYDASTLPTREEYFEKKAAKERLKMNNYYSSEYEALSKLVTGIKFPIFGLTPNRFFLTSDEIKICDKNVTASGDMIRVLKKSFPLLEHLSTRNVDEMAEYISLKQKAIAKNAKKSA